ncbi:hypothetical protein BO83DRAFT_414039 [Aspergillus eucalypticola CBS 122712]|uniref:Uncharacterized protein n=1 Tax=Aspergillus eucalypticola (strain CBS 122712 / IBT 29274) TaxID=1448314 RepID=A0A317W7V7_ASPEC|nr:uncharacterized protein BO83DRAFT_414039 [Aspergillus eucalypticola CBS 122712]PWY82473.1 hypothetical protein BO83DRAFT_414039 [Aspergillus eucalypticola CBS 122712]
MSHSNRSQWNFGNAVPAGETHKSEKEEKERKIEWNELANPTTHPHNSREGTKGQEERRNEKHFDDDEILVSVNLVGYLLKLNRLEARRLDILHFAFDISWSVWVLYVTSTERLVAPVGWSVMQGRLDGLVGHACWYLQTGSYHPESGWRNSLSRSFLALKARVLPQPCGRLPTSNGSHLGHMRNPSRINKSATARGVYDPIAGSWLAWQSKGCLKVVIVIESLPDAGDGMQAYRRVLPNGEQLRGPQPGGSKSPNDSWLRRLISANIAHLLSHSPHKEDGNLARWINGSAFEEDLFGYSSVWRAGG